VDQHESTSLSDRHEHRINEIYEWLHILNDLLIGLYFLIGSILFFYPHWENVGIWLFILGSAQMLIGPVIRTLNKLHVRRVAKKVLHY